MGDYVGTIVIGGGQSGLAMSYQLQQHGCEHMVIERARVAERWRTERWKSLRFQFPNWMIRLPGHHYDGDDPDGFMGCEGVVNFLTHYATKIAAPLHCGINVIEVRPASTGKRFAVETDTSHLESANVVVATGPYQKPSVPVFSCDIPAFVEQITANRYTSADQLPNGVLVVGAGASGVQIAEDLLRDGQNVFLSVGRHRRVPRRYRGKDYGWWQEEMGRFDTLSSALPADHLPPLLTGVNGGRDVDLRRLAEQGVTLLGSLKGASNGRLYFASDLQENLARGDQGCHDFRRSVDAYITDHGLDAPEEAAVETIETTDAPSLTELGLRKMGINAIIWATGYEYDFGWINVPVFDAHGNPIHSRGVTAVDGLYFLGLARLHKLKSSILWGVGDDARYLARHIAMRSSDANSSAN